MTRSIASGAFRSIETHNCADLQLETDHRAAAPRVPLVRNASVWTSALTHQCVGTPPSALTHWCVGTPPSALTHQCVGTPPSAVRHHCVGTPPSALTHWCVGTPPSAVRHKCVGRPPSAVRHPNWPSVIPTISTRPNLLNRARIRQSWVCLQNCYSILAHKLKTT